MWRPNPAVALDCLCTRRTETPTRTLPSHDDQHPRSKRRRGQHRARRLDHRHRQHRLMRIDPTIILARRPRAAGAPGRRLRPADLRSPLFATVDLVLTRRYRKRGPDDTSPSTKKRRFYQVRPGLGTRTEGDTSGRSQPHHHAASRSPVSQPSAESQPTSNTGIAGCDALRDLFRLGTKGTRFPASAEGYLPGGKRKVARIADWSTVVAG